MRVGEAQSFRDNLDDCKPYYCELEFIKALASLTALHWEEVDKPTQVGSQMLYDLLWYAASPQRLQWYFNNTRMMHSLPADMLNLVASGSASNESLNHEINVISKNQPTPRHLDSVTSQMDVFQQGKLLSHNSALYFPTTAGIPASDVLAVRVATLEIPISAWQVWCDKNPTVNPHRYGLRSKIRQHRRLVLMKLRARGMCLKKAKNRSRKRHPFNLVRQQ